MKKDLFAIAYGLTALILSGAAAYYVFFIQNDLVNKINQDPDLIALSARQEALGQRITKAAVGMGYSETQSNYLIFQSELSRIVPEWKKNHNALINGDEDLGIH